MAPVPRAFFTQRAVAGTSDNLPVMGKAKRTLTLSSRPNAWGASTSRPPTEMSSLRPSSDVPLEHRIRTGVTYGARAKRRRVDGRSGKGGGTRTGAPGIGAVARKPSSEVGDSPPVGT